MGHPAPPSPAPHLSPAPPRFAPESITRPDPRLMTYYTIVSALTLLAFPFIYVPLLLRYRTLRYRFDAEGIGMSVGLFFRRETYLTFRRIQDIHVTRGVIQRWLGLATVAIQTAAGSSTPEMTIEGVLDPDGLRDWLYARMRGAGEPAVAGSAAPAPGPGGTVAQGPATGTDEALALLREIRDELAATRLARGGGPEGRP